MDKSELVDALAAADASDGQNDGLDRPPTTNPAVWRGAITFGLITIPVGLCSAVEDRDISFHLLSKGDGSRIK